MYFTDDSLFPENMPSTIITAAPARQRASGN